MSAATFEVILPGNALVLAPEARYVTETPTGLRFEIDTPLEVVGAIIERLSRQHKRIEWALGDAMNFAEHRYGDTYAQWADETGLSENTLATIKWVAGAVESSRRREDVGWSHHREVAALPPEKQDALLERAADKGMTRWEVRQAAKVEAEQLRGRAVTADGACAAEEPEPLHWVPDVSELTEEARAALEAHAPGGRHRLGYVSGFLRALIYADQQDCFLPGRWRA